MTMTSRKADQAIVTETGATIRRGRRRPVGQRGLWLFLLPAGAAYALIVLLPTLQGVFFSFTNWNGLTPIFNFVGLQNYARILHDPIATKAITNTVIYAILTMVFINLFGLLLALALSSKIKSRNVLRVVFFLPVVLLSVVVSYLWEYLLQPDGALTEALHVSGFKGANPLWLGDPNLVVLSICVIVIWQFSGYTMVIYLAGLTGVPHEQIEAAHLDGAGPFTRFWYVTRPALAPAFAVNVLLTLIGGLTLFDQIWVTTQGGPDNASQSLSTLVYTTAFQYGQLGQGIALAVVLTIGVAVVAIAQYRLQLRNRGNS
jgi:raffinose/stachyose/melibiose transport system permease protein